MRVTDGFGNWQFLERSFTTLQRKTTVRIEEVVINNDGDPFATSDAQFDFDVIEAEGMYPSAHQEKVKSFGFYQDPITDGQKMPLSYVHVLGPKQIDKKNRIVSVAIRGHELDGFLEEDEYAFNGFFGNALEMPNGRGVETVLDRDHWMQVKPQTDTDFWFTTKVNYSVEYL